MSRKITNTYRQQSLEIKITAEGENNQISRYVKEIKREFPFKRIIGIYLTQYARQYKGKRSSCKILWEDVYQALENVDEKEGPISANTFREFLKYKQICAVPTISMPEWRYPCGTYEIQTYAEKCFWELAQEINENELLPKELLKDFKEVRYHHYWGRLGLTFCRSKNQSYKDWNPQIFIGLMIDLDTSEINGLFNNEIPFGMIVDMGSNYWDEVFESNEWKNFSNRLKEKSIHEGWNLYSITNNKNLKGQKWNPLIVFRSMVEIVNDPKQSRSRFISQKAPDYLSTLVISKTEELLRMLAEMKELQKLLEYFDRQPIRGICTSSDSEGI